MPFPQDRDVLIAAGYRFEDHGVCRGCHDEIEWYTSPKGKKMPFNLMEKGSSPAVAHFVTCPDSEEFRRG
jgi:hypothetical protein